MALSGQINLHNKLTGLNIFQEDYIPVVRSHCSKAFCEHKYTK